MPRLPLLAAVLAASALTGCAILDDDDRPSRGAAASAQGSTAPVPHLLCVAESKSKNKVFYTNPYARAAAMADGDGRAFAAHLSDRSYAKDAAYHCQPTANERAALQLLTTIRGNAQKAGKETLGVPWSPAR